MDPWRRLGVERGAPKTAVRAAFLREAKRHHPDAGGDPQLFRQAREAFDAINAGRSTFGDAADAPWAQHWEYRDGRWVVRERGRYHRPSSPVIETLQRTFTQYNRVRHWVFITIGGALVLGAVFDPSRGIIAKRRRQRSVPLSEWSWNKYKRTSWTSTPS